MKYAHIIGRVFNTPLMIAPAKAETIAAVLAPRLGLAPPEKDAQLDDGQRDRRPYRVTPEGIALIPVDGTLVHAAASAAPPSLFTSYGQIEGWVREAVADSAVRAVVLDIDSYGGEAAGCFDLSDSIYGLRGTKPIWAVADEAALSAAYAIASAADRVIVPRTGMVGSVGVIAMHLDVSRREEAEGLTWTAVFSGARKNDFTPHAPLSRTAREILQDSVDRTRNLFARTVARNRDMPLEAVMKTEAGIFEGLGGATAVEVGFADDIAPFREALAKLTASLDAGRTSLVFPPAAGAHRAPLFERGGFAAAAPPPRQGKESIVSQETEIEAAAAAADPDKDPSKDKAAAAAPPAPDRKETPAAAGNVVDLDAARGEGYAHAGEVAELCALAGRPDLTSGYLTARKPAAEVRQDLARRRAEGEQETIVSAVTPGARGADGKSPIVAACEALAEQGKKRSA